jgi:hypothetical protein
MHIYSQESVIWSHCQVTKLMYRWNFTLRKRSSQISFCYTRSDHPFFMINMLKMAVWCVCIYVSVQALSRPYLHHHTASHRMVVVCCHYRRLSGTCSFFIFVSSVRYMYICVLEESMHVYIVTKRDWSLRAYKHIAQGVCVCTVYIYKYKYIYIYISVST